MLDHALYLVQLRSLFGAVFDIFEDACREVDLSLDRTERLGQVSGIFEFVISFLRFVQEVDDADDNAEGVSHHR